jgi:hypothetical protein
MVFTDEDNRISIYEMEKISKDKSGISFGKPREIYKVERNCDIY